jgi:prevent-host-death family protein
MEVAMKEVSTAATTVSIRELKSRLSHYLRRAKAGQIVEITERGRPVGRIIPVVSSLEERIEAARRSGLLSWNGQKIRSLKPVAKLRTKKTVAELVVEDRR